MACPKCRCKTTYTYCDDDILGLPGDQERCANCGAIFFVDDAAEDDEDEDDQFRDTTEMMAPNAKLSGPRSGSD